MESARRWTGYVCPDCRFVFRVPRDHDGKGIVCPSCRRLLKIPTAGDTTPPLLATLRRMAADESASEAEPQNLKKHRRGKKSGSAGNHSWEQHSRSSRRGERRQMHLMLIGGAALFSLMVIGVVFSMNQGGKAVVQPAAAPEVVRAALNQAIPLAERGEVSLLAEAQPLVRQFLGATSVEDLLPLVRDPAKAEARMRAFYPTGKIKSPGLADFSKDDSFSVRGKFVSLGVITREHMEKSITLIETPQGLKVDWESWAGWSDIPWEKFLSTKPVTGHVFRVSLSAVDYYNFSFADESKWRSYRLVSADGENSIYGYVEKGSVVEQQIHPDAGGKGVALMLSLKFPTAATVSNQVEIERLVADGWVEEDSP